MAYGFLDIASTPSGMAAQTERGGRALWANFSSRRTFDRFTANGRDFTAARNRSYMPACSTTAGGPAPRRAAGFVKALYERTLGFDDYRGNRQYISLRNLNKNGWVR